MKHLAGRAQSRSLKAIFLAEQKRCHAVVEGGLAQQPLHRLPALTRPCVAWWVQFRRASWTDAQ